MIKLYKYLKLILALLAVTTLTVSCERENLLDIASYDGRTAYALVQNGTTYRLVIANIYFDKIFTSPFIFASPIASISANHKHIIVCDDTQTYKAGSNLTEWFAFAPKPDTPFGPILEYNDTFIVNSDTSPKILNIDTYTWENPYSSFHCDILFTGYDGNVYSFDGSNYKVFLLGSSAYEVTQFEGYPSGTPIGGYRTKNYFYVWSTYVNNSIARKNGSTVTVFNNTSSWNGVIDVAVNDNDELFAVIVDISYNLQLIKINDVDNFSTLLVLGPSNPPHYYSLNFLDNEHLILAFGGNYNGYNGLFIYNVKDNKIERFITTEDVISLYVTK